MKILISKLLAVMAVVFMSLSFMVIVYSCSVTMWYLLSTIVTVALVFYGIYKFIMWIFEEEMEDR